MINWQTKVHYLNFNILLPLSPFLKLHLIAKENFVWPIADRKNLFFFQVDHPLCEECTDSLLENIEGQLELAEQEAQVIIYYFHYYN